MYTNHYWTVIDDIWCVHVVGVHVGVHWSVINDIWCVHFVGVHAQTCSPIFVQVRCNY